ncbi:hypothetical protein PIB30_098415, partial [Stylosanthes scabra]|nr:hypothetical protein [Stylosanthes scabra]
MNSDSGAKEQKTVKITPVQPSNSNLRYSEFVFGIKGNNDNNRRHDLGINGINKNPEDM